MILNCEAFIEVGPLKSTEIEFDVLVENQAEQAREVLEEVIQLLEEYGPTWYTQDLHDRIENAIRALPK